jgi:hypothetical protein
LKPRGDHPRRVAKLLANQEDPVMAAEAVHYNMHDAKTHLSRIIERVEHGEESTRVRDA